jgi:hypothetical protein
MLTPIETLAQFAEPWKNAYADSQVLGVAVIFGHLGALLVGGGVAVSTDLASLRAFRRGTEERNRQLVALHESHRIVIGALIVMVITGLLLVAADVDTFLHSNWFFRKAVFVTFLVINGAVLFKASETIPRDGAHAEALWSRIRMVSVLSLVLWLSTVLLGTILQIAA